MPRFKPDMSADLTRAVFQQGCCCSSKAVARATQQFIKLAFISKQAQGPIDMRNRLSQLILKQRVCTYTTRLVETQRASFWAHRENPQTSRVTQLSKYGQYCP